MKKYSTKKIIISILLGLVCFGSAKKPITVDSAYDLYLMPGLILPAFIALYYGMRYAVISCTIGLAMFSPFLMAPANGWGNVVTSSAILLCIAGHGLCRDLSRKKKIPFFSLYIYQIIFVAIFLLLNKTLIQLAVRVNPPFWYKSYAFSYLPENLLNANSTVLAEVLSIIFLALNSFLSLPAVKRLLGIKINGYEKNNYAVMGIAIITAVISGTIATNGSFNGMMSITFTINSYQSSIGNVQLILLKEIMVFFAGDFLMHFLEYHNEQEKKLAEMAETQKAVFESSEDMIWSVNGTNGKIITFNKAAKEFFELKSGGFGTQKFFELFNDEDAVLWNDYFDETFQSGHYVVEYYDPLGKHYYQVQLHRIDLINGKYDIAVFAKDITETIAFEEQTKRMNDELEVKVLERTKEMNQAYKEMENLCFVIAHEFKSPVRAISLYNEILTEENGSSYTKEAEDASNKIKMYCNKTLDMIKEILEYSKMKSSRLNLVRVNMNNLVEEVISELKLINDKRDIRINLERLPNVMGDEILLRCCIYNILSNSVKYSSKRDYTDIHVTYEDAKDEYIFCFTDNGAGFDMEYAQNMFQIFHRMHLDKEFEGNGIGLVTVKNIIEKHGGRIEIEGEPDKGATVCFTIPK